MKIGINARFLLTSKMEGFGWYTFEITKRLVEQHPEHEFIFFFDRPFDQQFVFGSNATPVVLHPQARHPILHFLWFEGSITRALKKHRVDVFFSPDGYLSLRTKTPQIGVIHDINFEHFPKNIPFSTRIYLRYFFPKFARKAAKIITVSAYSKQDLVATYKLAPEKITVAWNGASDLFRPLPEEQQLAVREQFTNNNPYFLFVGAIHPRKNIQRLIQAFTHFKQTDVSNTQLLIVGTALWKQFNRIIKLDETTKNCVHFTGHLPLEDLSRIMASALALTYIPYFEGFGIPLLEAMKCGTPILAGNKTSLPEVAGNAALYCDPFNVAEITSKMHELVTNSTLRASLSKKGLARSTQFSWDNAAEEVWKELEQFNPSTHKKTQPIIP
jgi:glycosyltransferase involved in cell wall biosynthesis